MGINEQQIKPGVSVFVEGDVQATGVVVEVGGRLLGAGGADDGWVRVRLDGSDREVTVPETDIGQVL